MLTAKEIADELNVDISTISKWLTGKHKPMKKEMPNIELKFPGLVNLLVPTIEPGDSINGWLIIHKIYTDIQCKCLTCSNIRLLDILELYDKTVCLNCDQSNINRQETFVALSKTAHHKLHQCWQHMIRRCSSNASDIERKAYYESGVRVCEEWQGVEGEVRFKQWALANGYREGLQIDKDFKGDGTLYSPETCCFTTRANNNARRKKKIQSNEVLPYIGVSITSRGKFFAQVVWQGKRAWGKTFKTIEEAVIARNNYITSNNLPHVINIL